jgi:cytochrome c2
MKYALSAVAACAALGLVACQPNVPRTEPLTGGDPQAGQKLAARYGCAACHEIKGIAHSDTKVGPSLTELRKRTYVAGVLPNTSENLIRWIMHPHAYSPNTAMPELGVTEADARHIAAYLYSQ